MCSSDLDGDGVLAHHSAHLGTGKDLRKEEFIHTVHPIGGGLENGDSVEKDREVDRPGKPIEVIVVAAANIDPNAELVGGIGLRRIQVEVNAHSRVDDEQGAFEVANRLVAAQRSDRSRENSCEVVVVIDSKGIARYRDRKSVV